MNAVADAPRAPVAAPHATHKFKLLLKREFWEHKGGFFWAPIVTGAIICVLTLLGSVTGSIFLHNQANEHGVSMSDMKIDGENVQDLHRAMGLAGDATLLSGIGLAAAVLVFVVFFYALGSLYDDRKDRSVLFWKSLPVSDTHVVLSKAAWALLIAPALAIAIGLVIGVALWVISAATMLLNGVPGAGAIFTASHPLRVAFQVIATLPVYAFWALPTVGWLMLCSAWARSKPFLWAVLVPVLGATLISWLDTLPGLSIPHDSVWYVIGFRGLMSIIPGTWYLNPHVSGEATPKINSPQDLAEAMNLTTSWQAFATLDLWLGALAGAAMIYGAIRLRRWRDEG